MVISNKSELIIPSEVGMGYLVSRIVNDFYCIPECEVDQAILHTTLSDAFYKLSEQVRIISVVLVLLEKADNESRGRFSMIVYLDPSARVLDTRFFRSLFAARFDDLALRTSYLPTAHEKVLIVSEE